MTRLLLVEDDERIAGFVARGLRAEGYAVDVAGRGGDVVARLTRDSYDLVILDRMLPDGDGIEVCRAIRRDRRPVRVLMLTAKDAVQDRIDGLRGGADDYLTKPFAFDELLARVEALLRREGRDETVSTLQVGDLTLDGETRRVARGGRPIELTAKEFALLRYLMRHPGVVLSRQRLLSAVWDYNFDPGTKVVDVYIRYVRRKVDEGEAQPLIETVRGVGYRICAPEKVLAR